MQLAASLGLPFAIITDWDSVEGKQPLGKERAFNIWNAYTEVIEENKTDFLHSDFLSFSNSWKKAGFFFSDQTFEVSITQTPDYIAEAIELVVSYVKSS